MLTHLRVLAGMKMAMAKVYSMVLLLLLLPSLALATEVSVDQELVAQLVPLRVRAESVPKSLHVAMAQTARRQPLQACAQIVKKHQDLLEKAAPLFYQPDRRHGGDPDGISAFLKANVDGPTPYLQIVNENFVSAPGVRALGVLTCVRAGLAREAQIFVRDLALLHGDPQARLTLALLKALEAGQWKAALPWLDQAQNGPRADLLRALAGLPPGPKALLLAAQRGVATPEEEQLVRQVAKLLTISLEN